MNSNSLKIAYAFVCRHLYVTKKTALSNAIDGAIVVLFSYLTYACLLPLTGFDTALISPIFCGIIFLVMINVAFDAGFREAFDLAGTRLIDYHRTVPISLDGLILSYVICCMVDIISASIPVIAFGLILFKANAAVTVTHILASLCLYLLVVFLLAIAILLIVFKKPFLWMRQHTFPRLILPGTLLGALYIPWCAVFARNKFIGILFLCSPVTYVVEAIRATLLKEGMYLSPFITVPVLLLFSIVGAFVLRNAVRERLDSR